MHVMLVRQYAPAFLDRLGICWFLSHDGNQNDRDHHTW